MCGFVHRSVAPAQARYLRASDIPRARVVGLEQLESCVPWCFCSFSSLKCVLNLGFTGCLNLWIHSLFQVEKILHNYFFNYVFCLPHPSSSSLKILIVSIRLPESCASNVLPKREGLGEDRGSHLPLFYLKFFFTQLTFHIYYFSSTLSDLLVSLSRVLFKELFIFIECAWVFVCMCVWIPHVSAVPTETRRGQWIPWNWSSRGLWNTMECWELNSVLWKSSQNSAMAAEPSLWREFFTSNSIGSISRILIWVKN